MGRQQQYGETCKINTALLRVLLKAYTTLSRTNCFCTSWCSDFTFKANNYQVISSSSCTL